MDRPADLDTLPSAPGVYAFRAEGKVLYIGKAKNLTRRVSSYFRSDRSARVARMVNQAEELTWVVCASETEALVLEREWIAQHQPAFNVRLRNGGGYPGVALTKGSVPRLHTWRGRRPQGTRTFGPFPMVSARDLLSALTAGFGVRSCTDTAYAAATSAGTPCLLADTGHCLAPCVGRVSEEEHAEAAHALERFLRDGNSEVLLRLSTRMAAAASELRFEAAARFRDQQAALNRLRQRQTVVDHTPLDASVAGLARLGGRLGASLVQVRSGVVTAVETFHEREDSEVDDEEVLASVLGRAHEQAILPVLWSRVSEFTREPRGDSERSLVEFALKQARMAATSGHGQQSVERAEDGGAELASLLGGRDAIRRIEAIDVSHTAGRFGVAAVVCLVDGAAVRSEYRHVRVPAGGDDFEGVAAAVRARLSGSCLGLSALPDLLLIDGGAGQVAAAVQAAQEAGANVHIAGLAKRLEEVWLPGSEDPAVLSRDSAGLSLLIHARDLAHAEALKRHTALRDRAVARTLVDTAPGVGPARRKKLLNALGSHDAVVAATKGELVQVLGPVTGATLFDHLHSGEQLGQAPAVTRRSDA